MPYFLHSCCFQGPWDAHDGQTSRCFGIGFTSIPEPCSGTPRQTVFRPRKVKKLERGKNALPIRVCRRRERADFDRACARDRQRRGMTTGVGIPHHARS